MPVSRGRGDENSVKKIVILEIVGRAVRQNSQSLEVDHSQRHCERLKFFIRTGFHHSVPFHKLKENDIEEHLVTQPLQEDDGSGDYQHDSRRHRYVARDGLECLSGLKHQERATG